MKKDERLFTLGCNIRKLEIRLQEHLEKFLGKPHNEDRYLDILDLINYGKMIAFRLRKYQSDLKPLEKLRGEGNEMVYNCK